MAIEMNLGYISAEHAQNFEYPITIFTPTYNRAEKLKRAYRSLREQTYNQFEWLIIDDSSTDETSSLVKQWQEEAEFPIRFHVQEATGKHQAYNIAIRESKGELFVSLDADDELFPNAVERLLELWGEIPDNRDDVVGISCLCADEEGNINGEKFPEDRMFANYFELRYKYKVTGDGIGCNRTSVLRQYPFPTPGNVRYVPESTVGSEIAKEYNQYCVNEVLGIYHSEAEEQSDQLTKRKNTDDAKSFVIWHQKRLNEHLSWFRYDPMTFFISAAGFTRHSFHTGEGPLTQVGQLGSLGARLLWALAFPVGYAAYVVDKWSGDDDM
ncbi:glycosyltransferase family 2 protein [Halobellus rubicundus]|uniref:Glycosyltransferase family 2 protein n=1 Tax=Halobellus rubicundus TaxID=2996466 RepID=A0ABD5MI34_9EURY